MTYLELVNKALLRLNEVQLTSANFASTTDGVQAFVKDAVNTTLEDIYSAQFGWPFNYLDGIEILAPGTTSYDLPLDYAHVDWDSFWISRGTPDSSVLAKTLRFQDYDTYISNLRDNDINIDATSYTQPTVVTRHPNGTQFIVSSTPDKAYELNFQYYKRMTLLSDPTDVTDIPERYHGVIMRGVMQYAYMFREDLQQAGYERSAFKDGVGQMRRELIPQPRSMRVL